jgi:hypothetical protein
MVPTFIWVESSSEDYLKILLAHSWCLLNNYVGSAESGSENIRHR